MTDSFLQSMTFSRASDFFDACDCDDCDNIPPSIQKFINDRKRQRMKTGHIKRTQQRTLVGQHDRTRISLFSMFMPKHAEPLIEFGSSHRIVWVKRLVKPNKNQYTVEYKNSNSNHSSRESESSSSILQWIGKGIIGSSDEEKDRIDLNDWTEGSVHFVPSNGGKAVGWIHTSAARETSVGISTYTNAGGSIEDANKKEELENKTTTKTVESDGFAILYVAKIPLDVFNKKQEESEESNQEWVNALIECCRDGIGSFNKESDKVPSYYKFPIETSELLKKIIREVEDAESKDDTSEPASKRICRKQPDA